MTNPFKYIPAIATNPTDPNQGLFYYYSRESKWGFTIFKSKNELIPDIRHRLVHKETHEKIKIFTKPIDMKRYLELRGEVEYQIWQRLKPSNIISKDRDLNIDISKEYEEEYGKVKAEWAKKMEASGGTFLIQFNAKTTIFGDNWVRMVQRSCNELNGNAEYLSYKKISWFRYFFLEMPIRFMVTLYCKLNNFRYRREIAKEKIEEKRRFDEMIAESAMIFDIKQKGQENEQ